MPDYAPPFTLNNALLTLVADISELIGRLSAGAERLLPPKLRRGNRIRTIQASLAIEQNTLSIEQVTAVLDGKRVLGLPREIQEIRNAFTVYERLMDFDPASCEHLLSAHAQLMYGLADDAGQWRNSGVGIYRERQLVHMPPPASQVPRIMKDLVTWFSRSDLPPLLKSCIFHYEFEFIHPFSDGNGRMGRLWQTLILAKWRPELAYLPMESVIKKRQEAYYQALRLADNRSDATPFVEFMLQAIKTALDEVTETHPAVSAGDQVSDQVSDQVMALLNLLNTSSPLSASDLMGSLGLKHRPSFRKSYLLPALQKGLARMTKPESPRSPQQKYRLTRAGSKHLKTGGPNKIRKQ